MSFKIPSDAEIYRLFSELSPETLEELKKQYDKDVASHLSQRVSRISKEDIKGIKGEN